MLMWSVAQSCSTLCDTTDCSPSGSYVHGILDRQEYWSGLPFPSPGDLPDPGIKCAPPALTGRFFTTALPGKSPGLKRESIILK